MGFVVRIDAEDRALTDRVKHLVRREDLLLISTQAKNPFVLPVPRLVLIACQYQCHQARCSRRFVLARLYPQAWALTQNCIKKPEDGDFLRSLGRGMGWR